MTCGTREVSFGCSPVGREISAGGPCFHWLPIVDAYRTICIAATPEVKSMFEAIREFGSAA
jgi:hypothetical protein